MKRALVPVLLAVACASAEKSFEKAQKAESEGRWGAAADLYIDALKRDAEYPGARDGLRIAGNRAVADSMKLAQQLEASRRYEPAANEYVRTDDLVARASAVRVALTLPADHAARRRSTFDQVIDPALTEADRLAAQGRHEEAAAAYRRATARYQPSAQQRERASTGRFTSLMAAAKQELDAGRLDQAQSFADDALGVYGSESSRSRTALELQTSIRSARYTALLATARERMAAGRFQESFAIVGEALAVYGADAEPSAEARELREQVIVAGTVQVAIAPVWRHERLARAVPAGLLDEINDGLDEYLVKPPLFVEPVDPRVVRGELRRLGLDRTVLSERQASAIGQMVAAEFAVVANLRECVLDRGEKPKVHPVKTKDGPDAEILVYRRRTLAVRCVFRIVRVADGQLLGDGTISADVERKMRHAAYDGDRRALLLTQQEHRWFDRRRLADVDRELQREASRALADGLAAAVFEEVTRQLP